MHTVFTVHMFLWLQHGPGDIDIPAALAGAHDTGFLAGGQAQLLALTVDVRHNIGCLRALRQ